MTIIHLGKRVSLILWTKESTSGNVILLDIEGVAGTSIGVMKVLRTLLTSFCPFFCNPVCLKVLLQHCARTIYWGKLWFKSFRPKCFCPIRLQDSLIFDLSGMNQSICKSSHYQTCLDKPMLRLVDLEKMARLKIAQKKRLINF